MPGESITVTTLVKPPRNRWGLLAFLLIPIGIPGLGYAVYHYEGGAPARTIEPVEAQLEFPVIPPPCCAPPVETVIQLPLELALPATPGAAHASGPWLGSRTKLSSGLAGDQVTAAEALKLSNQSLADASVAAIEFKAPANKTFKGQGTQHNQSVSPVYTAPAFALNLNEAPVVPLTLPAALPVNRGVAPAQVVHLGLAAPVMIERAPARFIDANEKPKTKSEAQAPGQGTTRTSPGQPTGGRAPASSDEAPAANLIYLPSGTEQLAVARGFEFSQATVPYQGLWIGQFSGEAAGNLRISITTNGVISGLGSTFSTKLFPVVGTVSREGRILIKTDGFLSGAEFKGKLGQGLGTGSGTWTATGSTEINTWKIDLQTIQQ